MNHAFLNKFDWRNPPNFSMQRKKEVQQQYDKEIGSPKQTRFIDHILSKIEEDGFVFIANTYPYDLDDGIKHTCLWYKGVFTPDDVVIYLRLHHIKYITFFENDSKFRSIKTISHYHIFHY